MHVARRGANNTTGTAVASLPVEIDDPTEIQVGHSLIIRCLLTGQRTLTSITDPRGNTWYVVTGAPAGPNSVQTHFAVCPRVNFAYEASDVLTVNWSNTGHAVAIVDEFEVEVAPIAQPPTSAEMSSGEASEATAEFDSGATATTAEHVLIIGEIGYVATGTVTPSGDGWTALGAPVASTTTVRTLAGHWRVAAAAAAAQYAGTLSVGRQWSAMVVALTIVDSGGAVVDASGVATGASEADGQASVVTAGRGTADGTAAADGAATVVAGSSGVAEGSSEAAGAATVAAGVAGVADGAAEALGASTVRAAASGAAAGAAGAAGHATALLAAHGLAAGTSEAIGVATVGHTVDASGVADGASSAAGVATVIRAGAGVAVGAAAAAGSPTALVAVVGVAGGAAHLDGVATVIAAAYGLAVGTSSAIGVPTTGADAIGEVLHGSTSIANGQTQVVVGLGVELDLEHAWPRITTRLSTTTGNHTHATPELFNSAGETFLRVERGGTTGVLAVEWQVIYHPGWHVQRIETVLNAVGLVNEALDAPVPLGETWLDVYSRHNVATGAQIRVSGRLPDDSTLEFVRLVTTGVVTAVGYVITAPGSIVQSGTTVLTGTGAPGEAVDVALDQVDLDRTFVIQSQSNLVQTGAAANQASLSLASVELPDDETLRVARVAGHATVAVQISWFVAQLADAWVQTSAVSSTVASVDDVIETVYRPRAFVVHSYRVNSTTANTATSTRSTAMLPDADAVRYQRATTTGTAFMRGYIIELPGRRIDVRGVADGTSEAVGTAAVSAVGFGLAAGTSEAVGRPNVDVQAAGVADGTATAEGVAAILAVAAGIAAGTSEAYGVADVLLASRPSREPTHSVPIGHPVLTAPIGSPTTTTVLGRPASTIPTGSPATTEPTR